MLRRARNACFAAFLAQGALHACHRGDEVPACAGKTPNCADLARMYEVGDGVAVDANMAARLYDRGCRAGETAACEGLGRLYEGDSPALSRSHVESEADAYMSRQIPTYRKSCSAGDRRACEVPGDLYAGGLYGLAKSADKAVTFYEMACRSGSATACDKATRL
ncbi:MAG: hypothetical protein AAF715_25050 [Myxococcota bacterium]